MSTYARLALATALLATSRQHGLYLIAALLPFVLFALRLGSRKAVLRAVAAVGVGCVPAIALQVYRAVEYGSPIAPSELKLFGIQLASGVPIRNHLIANGIMGDDAVSLAKGFADGWLWKAEWPMGAFYHSQWAGTGFITLFALFMLPVALRVATKTEHRLLVGLVLVSLVARDFALPRWAYTLTIAVVVLMARAMSALATSRRGAPLFWLGASILIAQLFRPEFDLAQIEAGYWISPRVNVMASPWFSRGPGELRTFPDRWYKLAIIEHTRGGYTAHLFGRRLTNEVVGTVRERDLGERCAGVRALLARVPEALFVDDLDLTRSCTRTCVLAGSKACKLFAITPP